MNLKTIYKISLILLIFLPFGVNGQISYGGIPIQIQKQKSASSGNEDLVIMPSVDNQKMRKLHSQAGQNILKPLRFAHSFDVSLSPKNSGKWYNTTQVNVWQLRIRSIGAYSLNLIMSQYKLPEHARLFLISMKTGEIKGAYTSANNSDSHVFAIEPVEGDELLVQYEEPAQVDFPGEILISKVAHDFVGVTAKEHRPLGISGICNVNVNCDQINGSENVRDAVCRIIVEGKEICTGTLMNNTALDGTPYVLTANHCISSETKAQSSIFLFNYESPYCMSVDGDVSRSLSGSSLRASFDSLDFALVRLNSVPPFYYRPYLAGWNRKNIPPSSSICIHHPIGDIKKVAIDNDAAVTGTYSETSQNYRKNGFWNILWWENGTTEQGSSGGPLFDQNKQLVGTLTGGEANCTFSKNDYFEKIALAWDLRKEPNKQLKTWLDPLYSNAEKLDGMSLYTGKMLCRPITNFKDNDTHVAIQITNGLIKKGYWTGSNLVGFSEFAEQFKFSKSSEVLGVALGIAKVKTNPAYPNSSIEVKVYSGKDKPETLLYSEKYDINKFWADAMNYIPFKGQVKTSGEFFISYNISQLHEGDTLAVYMANRKSDITNTFFLKNQEIWSTYNAQNLNGNGSALLMELIACNVEDLKVIEDSVPDLKKARFFPNPITASSVVTVQTVDSIDCPEDVTVFDLLGKRQNVPVTINGAKSLSLNLAGNRPGIYFIHLEAGGRTIVGKVAYMPY